MPWLFLRSASHPGACRGRTTELELSQISCRARSGFFFYVTVADISISVAGAHHRQIRYQNKNKISPPFTSRFQRLCLSALHQDFASPFGWGCRNYSRGAHHIIGNAGAPPEIEIHTLDQRFLPIRTWYAGQGTVTSMKRASWTLSSYIRVHMPRFKEAFLTSLNTISHDTADIRTVLCLS